MIGGRKARAVRRFDRCAKPAVQRSALVAGSPVEMELLLCWMLRGKVSGCRTNTTQTGIAIVPAVKRHV